MEPAGDRAVENTGYPLARRDIREAYEHQKSLGFTDTVGLYHCGKYLLDANSQELRSAFSAWWHEVQDFTFRDQISFPYIMQRFNLPIRVLEKWQFHQVFLGEQK